MADYVCTQDNVPVSNGCEAFNYYDMKKGIVDKIDDHAQPNTMKGQTSSTPVEEWDNYWFTFIHDDGSRTTLDGSRICSIQYATKKGWIK